MSILLKHAHLVSPGWEVADGALEVQGERILSVRPETPRDEHSHAQVFDLGGRILAPGFIDIHAHGHSNFDFCDGTLAAFKTIAEGKLREGVTTLLPTTLSVSVERLYRICQAANDYVRETVGQLLPSLPGLHVEGPFIVPECAGAQNPEHLKSPDLELIDDLARRFPVIKVSYSPELDSSLDFTIGLCQRGIMPSGAHSAADYECFQRHRLAGMKQLTHFCNVMTPVHHLRFGMVGGGLMADDVFVEMICDGVHLCDEMIQLIIRLKTPERIMLITDSMKAAGMPDGTYELGGLPVTVKGKRATLTGTETVAGSTLRYHEGLKRICRVTGRALPELIAATSWNQARSLGLKHLGKLETGFLADLVVLNENLDPCGVFLRGKYREW